MNSEGEGVNQSTIDSTAGGTEKADERLTKAEVFELLSVERRQQVMLYLDRADGQADVGELAEHIASIECDCEPSKLSSQQRKRVYVGLYQCHLPKMADAGVIDYNADRGFVGLNENSVRLLKYLHFEEESDDVQKGILNRLL